MPELTIVSPSGSITISRDLVAEIVAETAARCYGVVGLAAGSRVGRLLRRGGERLSRTVHVEHRQLAQVDLRRCGTRCFTKDEQEAGDGKCESN